MKLSYYAGLIALTFSFNAICAETASDKLVAIVEQKPVMESELHDRFALNKLVQPGLQNVSFENIRSQLIEEICLEKMNEALWERVGFSQINPTAEQVQAFKKFYKLDQLSDKAVLSFYTAKLRENEISRSMVQPSIELTDLEISTFARQKRAWQALGALWSFKIAYSDSMPDSEPTQFKSFEKISVDKIQPSLFRQIDWKKMGQWQHFKDDGEIVSFFLENIEIPSLSTTKYNIQLQVLQKDPQDDSLSVARIVPITVKNSSDLSPELWEQLLSLQAGAVSEPIQIATQWYQIKLIDSIAIADSYESMVTAQFKEMLKQKKTEEKMPSWYSDMKKNFYIQIIEP